MSKIVNFNLFQNILCICISTIYFLLSINYSKKDFCIQGKDINNVIISSPVKVENYSKEILFIDRYPIAWHIYKNLYLFLISFDWSWETDFWTWCFFLSKHYLNKSSKRLKSDTIYLNLDFKLSYFYFFVF